MTVGTDEVTETDQTTETDPPATDDHPKGPGREAAKYRVERNAAREALTAAESRIEALQTREVERLAADLAAPHDLFDVGQVALTDLLDETGNLDQAAVIAAVAELIAARPGLAKTPSMGAYDPTQGQSGGQGKPAPSWGEFLRA